MISSRFYAILFAFVVLGAATTSTVSARRAFRLGRHWHGTLGVSHSTNKLQHHHRQTSTNVFLSGPQPPSNDSVQTLWFDQELDHFNADDQRTWQQKYQTNSQYYKLGGPLFLMLGGEGPAELKWLTSGAWIEMYAPRFSAMAFQLEHRYYGDSQPVENLSTANLRYLSSEQALADAANFIVKQTAAMNLTLGTTQARWVVFGGSYSGALAAWLRYKYPHLVFAAVASSGPVEAQLNFATYMDNVVYAMQQSTVNKYHSNRISHGKHATNGRRIDDNTECVDAVAQAVAQVKVLLTSAEGRAQLQQKFQLCDNTLDSQRPEDLSNFMESLASNFQGVVQYNRDNRQGPLHNLTIDDLCDIMTSPSGVDDERDSEPIDRYAKINTMLLVRNEEPCLDISYANMIGNLTDVSWNASDAEGGRQWTYQTCTEFGYYQTSDSNISAPVFGNDFPLPFFTKQCLDIFSDGNITYDEITQAVAWSNTNYGGKNLETSRTIFVNGKIDPWHLLGITEQASNDAPVIFMHDTAHCADMYSPSPNDSVFLQNGRAGILKYLATWLSSAKYWRH